MVRTQVNNDGSTTRWIALNEPETKWKMDIIKGNATRQQVEELIRLREQKVLPFIYDPDDFNRGAMEGTIGRSNNIHGELSQ